MTELESCYERINCIEDTLSTVLSYLDGDPSLVNAKLGLIVEIESLLKDDWEAHRYTKIGQETPGSMT